MESQVFLFYNSVKKENGRYEIAGILNLDVKETKRTIEGLKGFFRRKKSRVQKGMHANVILKTDYN